MRSVNLANIGLLARFATKSRKI